MKLFNAIAVAVMGSAALVVTPAAEASLNLNLNTGNGEFVNDGDERIFITKGSTQVLFTGKVKREFVRGLEDAWETGNKERTLANPLPGEGAGATKSVPIPNGFKGTLKSIIANGNSHCPAGTSYHKIRVGGLIKRTAAEGCFTDFQASQLRMQANANQQQRLRDFQRNLNESIPSPVNCSGTVNNWGGGYNTYDATCY